MTANTAVVFLVMLLLGAPKLILIVIATAVLQLFFMLLITLRWKISGHCTAVAGLVVLALALFGENLLPSTLLIPLVAWSRIRLKRHTPAQTVAGSFMGAVIVSTLLYFTNIL
jgi:membrane-associated phospholipid phosphatase